MAATAPRPLHPGFPSLFERSRALARFSVLPALGLAADTLLCLASTPARARAESPVVELRHTSLEELLNLHVSSAAKQEERIWDTDAAVEVITSEAMR